MDKVYLKSRYDKGEACSIEAEEEFKLHLNEFEKYFEGCMPFEVMAERGRKLCYLVR